MLLTSYVKILLHSLMFVLAVSAERVEQKYSLLGNSLDIT